MIGEVTIGDLLSMKMLPTTESTMLLNFGQFAPTRSRIQDLRCYEGSCNH
jgi:hypothetical protein